MYAAISSVDLRSDGNSHLKFKLNENVYNDASDRVVSRVETLDGDVVVTDWGFAEGRRVINLTIDMPVDDYEILVDFQEDNTNTFLFHYKGNSYLVIVRSVVKNALNGTTVRVAVKLDVVQKVNGGGEYSTG